MLIVIANVRREAPYSARLRGRNQLTLPEPVVARLGAHTGDRFLVIVEGADSVRLVRLRESYAGAFPGMWGETQDEADAWLREERASWHERQARYEDPDRGSPG
jgi:bifunctional DNA-binding transcriptional regulator/antitoxin component of YhaV-PrlF toxin-antitoxin module